MFIPLRDLSDMEDNHPFNYKNEPKPKNINVESMGVNLKAAYDPVNKPSHYSLNHKGIEAIQAIEAALTPEEFQGFLKGNIIKYIWREKYKNKLEDKKKAVWYANKLVEVSC